MLKKYFTAKYLPRKIAIFLLTSATLLFFCIIITGMNSVSFPVQVWSLVLLMLLLLMWGYFWILRPYNHFCMEIRRFNEGYLSLQEITDRVVFPTKELEEMILQLQDTVKAVSTVDLSKRQAQYRALQNQINPHFLYNTLEGIRSEALIAGMDQIADMTESLAVFFRYTISKVENLVTVEEEMDNCQTYFNIQQYRFGSRISMQIIRDEDWEEIRHFLIPKLTLQPILENSIIHGIELKLGEGKLSIEFSRSASRLNILVSDNGVGMNQQTLDNLNGKLSSKEEELKNIMTEDKEAGGVALTNVNNRIHLIFGEEYGMHVYSLEGFGTEVELSLPAVSSEKELQKIKGTAT